MFIDSGRNPSILIRRSRGKPIKDAWILIRALNELGYDPSRVGTFIHLDVDRSLHRIQVFARIVQMIQGRPIVHAADEERAITLETKFAGRFHVPSATGE